MPGVDLDILPTSSTSSELSSPEKDQCLDHDSSTGDENLIEQKFESLLRCAVHEIHMDLKAFGKQVDETLEEAALLAPLAQTLAQLQEENKFLKGEQERLEREVEVLCQAMKLQDVHLERIASSEVQSKTSSLLGSPQGVPQKFQSSPGEAKSSPIDLAQDLSSQTHSSHELHLDSQYFESSEIPVHMEFYTDLSQRNANSELVWPNIATQESEDLKTSPETVNPQNLEPKDDIYELKGSLQEVQGLESYLTNTMANALEDEITCDSEREMAACAELEGLWSVPHRSASSHRRSLSAPALVGFAPDSTMETEPTMASETVFSAPPSAKSGRSTADLPNGSSAPPKPEQRPGKLTPEMLAAIEDEELLDKMLDESKDFEERRLIRAAMRDLRKRKREAMLGCTQEEMDQREKERESRLQELRQQRDQKTASRGGTGEVVVRKQEKSVDGNKLSQVTKTDHFEQSDDGSRSSRSTVVETSYVQKTDRGTVQSKSYSFSSSSSSSSSMSSNTKKVGSVFDREDDSLSRGGGSGGLAAVERRQAERRKELMRAQTMPKSTSMQARKAMIERLDKDASGGSGGPAVVKINRVQRSTSFGVPNANTIKQMLLDWCRVKTRSYEHVDIQNFSSSWSNGMAFCALVHHFFPEAFDYSSLNPAERRHNFDLAFSTAERMVDCPQLLDVDDMVKMREPDWKCVYTYLQEFYRGLVTKGLVKTRANSS